jgi:hypothetical protein
MAGRDRQRETWPRRPSFGGGARGGGPASGRESGHGLEFECLDFCPICRTADVLRATMPAEFQDHWHAWQREMLLAVRSLLDHYIERIESERRRAVQVEDIPIE